MKILKNNLFSLEAEKYNLEFIENRPSVRVKSKAGDELCELFLISSCHSIEKKDATANISEWKCSENDGRIEFTAEADSLAWDKKIYHLVCKEDRIEYYYEIEGKGNLGRCEYFTGYYVGSVRLSSGRFYSGFPVDSVFNPEPDICENPFFGANERSLIDMTGVPFYGRDHWFFTPPPFCFVCRKGDTCYTLGVSAEDGKHTFTELEYLGGRGGGLSVSYEGCTKVDGKYILPTLSIIFGSGEYSLIKKFSEIECHELKGRVQQDWWRKPIFCGWGAQCAMANERKAKAPELSRQEFYEEFIKDLDKKGLKPGTIVIDDKWQKNYGLNTVDTEKWPDLKGFIKHMHEKGYRILLWQKAWDPNGVNDDLCIRDFSGNKIATDPTNPGYKKILGDSVKYMLSPEGLDADGFKIDFTARIPSGPGSKICDSSIWGLELMRAYLAILHDTAKSVKADALIMSHTPHPYLEDKVDMIRLNDVNTASRVNEAMTNRARVASAACTSCLIDTDNWPMPDKKTWLDYVRIQPQLGVPSLYYLWHMDNSDEKIYDEDLDVVRNSWKEYEKRLKK